MSINCVSFEMPGEPVGPGPWLSLSNPALPN